MRIPRQKPFAFPVGLIAVAAIVWLTTLRCVSQQPENPLVAQYQEARAAYTAKQFQKSAALFRSVANQCQGSELAIQCEYFAAISNWTLEPSDATASKLSDWIAKTTQFRDEALAAHRSFDDKLMQRWMENSNVLHAKWDRQKQRFDLAEARLRGFLKNAPTDSNQSNHSPAAWLELGSLLLECRQDCVSAKECFHNALGCCGDSEDIAAQATLGVALACFHERNFTEAKSHLDQLANKKLDDNLAIQLKLLQIKVSKAVGESIDTAQSLEPSIRLAIAGNPQASVLYELAMALLDAGDHSNSNEILVQLVHRFPQTPVSIEARVRLARNAMDSSRWQESLQWSGQAIQMGCSEPLQPHAEMLRGRAKMELGDLDGAQTDFELALKHESASLDLKVSVHFQLAETLYQLERWPEAETHWTWLKQFAQSKADSDSPPDWLPVILLRTAELLALKKEWDQAEEIVLRIRNDFPKCNRSCEVDYLFARCLISKADFDAARKVLDTLTRSIDNTPAELLARANWMVGETYLLQRKYEAARNAYQQVLKIPKQNHWHSAALLQIGQCCEATQDTQGARNAYSQIANEFGESPFASLAKQRLSLLPSSSLATQPNQSSPGTKR
ncbi:MAG: tetratricopeptide repeat protein [Planctomycetota bacterium]|nr:tetratricopeptide repeat protein [Planctomycetota bacterium]